MVQNLDITGQVLRCLVFIQGKEDLPQNSMSLRPNAPAAKKENNFLNFEQFHNFGMLSGGLFRARSSFALTESARKHRYLRQKWTNGKTGRLRKTFTVQSG